MGGGGWSGKGPQGGLRLKELALRRRKQSLAIMTHKITPLNWTGGSALMERLEKNEKYRVCLYLFTVLSM